MLNIKKCDKCQCSDWLCICDKVDRFFEACDSLKPYDGPKPLAKVYDLAVFRVTREKKEIA